MRITENAQLNQRRKGPVPVLLSGEFAVFQKEADQALELSGAL